MHRDNGYMYMEHVCFMSIVQRPLLNIVFLALECFIMLYVCVRDVMDVVSCWYYEVWSWEM